MDAITNIATMQAVVIIATIYNIYSLVHYEIRTRQLRALYKLIYITEVDIDAIIERLDNVICLLKLVERLPESDVGKQDLLLARTIRRTQHEQRRGNQGHESGPHRSGAGLGLEHLAVALQAVHVQCETMQRISPPSDDVLRLAGTKARRFGETVKKIEKEFKKMDGLLRRVNCGLKLCDFTVNDDVAKAADGRLEVSDNANQQAQKEGLQDEEYTAIQRNDSHN